MVFPDLSAPEAYKKSAPEKRQHIAPVADRSVAFVLDFLIFSPIISLFIAGLMRQSKTFFLINPTSNEGLIALALSGLLIFFFSVCLQTLFLYFWQATPGQLFLQMRVISYPEYQRRLSFNQCVIRSFFWCFNFVLCAIPFMEILSHPKRRALHERCSDTLVVTLKEDASDVPHILETRFISSWTRIAFTMMLAIGLVSFFKVYYGLQAGSYKESADLKVAACEETLSSMDTAVALFLADGLSHVCLNEKAEETLWSSPTEELPYAYLARFLITEGPEQEKYFSKVCEDDTGMVCSLAIYIKNKETGFGGLEKVFADSKTAQVLLIDEKFNQRDFVGSLELIESLQKDEAFEIALEKKYVRAVWSLQEQAAEERVLQNQLAAKGVNSRQPASYDVEDVEEAAWLQEFKERYDIQ